MQSPSEPQRAAGGCSRWRHPVAVGRPDDEDRHARRLPPQRRDLALEAAGVAVKVEIIVEPLIGAEGDNKQGGLPVDSS